MSSAVTLIILGLFQIIKIYHNSFLTCQPSEVQFRRKEGKLEAKNNSGILSSFDEDLELESGYFL